MGKRGYNLFDTAFAEAGLDNHTWEKEMKLSLKRKLLSFLLAFVLLLSASACIGGSNSPKPSGSLGTIPVLTPEALTAAPTAEPYVRIQIPTADQDKGQLVLVNYQYGFNHTDELITEPIAVDANSVLLVDRADIELPCETVEALRPLAEKFYEHCGHRLYITSGYRTEAYQRQLYIEYEAEHGTELAMQYVAQPGTSEHHTGLAVDLSTLDANGQRTPLANHAEADWFDIACTDYGFILRYPIGTQEFTHIQYEPWHFRYVGRETAHAVAALGMTYEEYIEHMKQYSVESGMLYVRDEALLSHIAYDENGEIALQLPEGYIDVAFYNEAENCIALENGSAEGIDGAVMWYVPASSDAVTEISIPRCITEYAVYGTNCGGFIVIGQV